MQTQKQDYVKCKYCKERIHVIQMYAHNLECNSSNHPNFNSEINSVVKSNQSHLQQQRVPNQETNVQQSSSRQPVQFVESQIQSSLQPSTIQQEQQFVNNERHSNYPQQNNTQEIQQLNQSSSNFYTESLLKQVEKKCEYCDEVYPIQLLEQHYPLCQAKILTESLYLADDQDQNNHYQALNQQDSQVNQDHHYPRQFEDDSDSSENENSSYVTRIQEELMPDGTILKTTSTTNFITGEVKHRTETIPLPQQYQQSQQQQQYFPPLSFSRRLENQNQGGNFTLFDSIFNTNIFSNQPRGARNIFMPMTNPSFLHRVPQELTNIAVIKYAPYDGLAQEYKQCSICLTDYEDGEELILLPCIHRFHKTCISEWFKEMTTCPICKNDVTQQEMAFEEDDQL